MAIPMWPSVLVVILFATISLMTVPAHAGNAASFVPDPSVPTDRLPDPPQWASSLFDSDSDSEPESPSHLRQTIKAKYDVRKVKADELAVTLGLEKPLQSLAEIPKGQHFDHILNLTKANPARPPPTGIVFVDRRSTSYFNEMKKLLVSKLTGTRIPGLMNKFTQLTAPDAHDIAEHIGAGLIAERRRKGSGYDKGFNSALTKLHRYLALGSSTQPAGFWMGNLALVQFMQTKGIITVESTVVGQTLSAVALSDDAQDYAPLWFGHRNSLCETFLHNVCDTHQRQVHIFFREWEENSVFVNYILPYLDRTCPKNLYWHPMGSPNRYYDSARSPGALDSYTTIGEINPLTLNVQTGLITGGYRWEHAIAIMKRYEALFKDKVDALIAQRRALQAGLDNNSTENGDEEALASNSTSFITAATGQDDLAVAYAAFLATHDVDSYLTKSIDQSQRSQGIQTEPQHTSSVAVGVLGGLTAVVVVAAVAGLVLYRRKLQKVRSAAISAHVVSSKSPPTTAATETCAQRAGDHMTRPVQMAHVPARPASPSVLRRPASPQPPAVVDVR